MTILDSIITTAPRAPRITLYGRPGIGKSTLAASFPEPLFLLTEDAELNGINALPLITSFEQMWDTVKQLLAVSDLPYKTIVIDSISKLDHLVINHILASEPQKNGKQATLSSACGGYGAGFSRAQGIHRAFKSLMDRFKDKGVTVIYVSHLAIANVKPPDSEDYTIYTVVMNHDKSREVYIDDVDAVFYCKQKEFVSSTDTGRSIITSTNERVIVTGMSGSYVSKNRYNMPLELNMSFAEIKKHIPFYKEL